MTLPRHAQETIQRIVRTLRTQLGREVAFLWRDGTRTNLVRQTHTETTGIDGAAARPGTFGIPVVSAIDGVVYGALRCMDAPAAPPLDEDAVTALRLMATLIADCMDDVQALRRREDQRRRQLCGITADRDLAMVFQPIVRMPGRQCAGFEALARFPRLAQSPLDVFTDAWALGVGVDLEIKAVRAALGYFRLLPDDVFMTVNVSPITLATSDFFATIEQARSSTHRMVIEVTEHAAVSDYDALLAVGARLRRLGVRVAIDDVGMGFSGLNHIIRVQPDIIKLDAGMVRHVDTSVAKQAMVEALVRFALRTGTTVIAEGVETEDELACVEKIGVTHAQGYLIRRPRPLTIGRPLTPERVRVAS
jgi:EAL domain-containing protein (putative c-di-GMP-specific phosphodiesterase class I)